MSDTNLDVGGGNTLDTGGGNPLAATLTTSDAGGYLQPRSVPILGQALSRFLQQIVAGVTGLDGTLVRPRWQAEPANVPDFGIAWCAIGIQRRATQGFAWEQMVESPHFYSLSRQEELTLLCSFYDNGVDQTADLFATQLRDGLQLGQNREALNSAGFGYIGSGDLIPLPSLLKQRWLYRVDLPLYFRRTLTWTYAVEALAASAVVLEVEDAAGRLVTQTISLP